MSVESVKKSFQSGLALLNEIWREASKEVESIFVGKWWDDAFRKLFQEAVGEPQEILVSASDFDLFSILTGRVRTPGLNFTTFAYNC